MMFGIDSVPLHVQQLLAVTSVNDERIKSQMRMKEMMTSSAFEDDVELNDEDRKYTVARGVAAARVQVTYYQIIRIFSIFDSDS